MSEKEKKDVVKTESNLPVRTTGENQLPAGLDDIDPSKDLKMPRLAILQGLSQLVIDGKAKMGDLANSLTKEVYGNTVEFIPLFMFKSRVQFEVGKGIVMLSRDNKTVTWAIDELEQWIGANVEEVPGASWQGKTPPSFSEVFNFPCIFPTSLRTFPVALSLMRTGAPAAKELCSLARYAGEDIFARVYTLKTENKKNEKGTFAVPSVEFVRRCTEEEYAIAKNYFDNFYRLRSKIEVDLENESLDDSVKSKSGVDGNGGDDEGWKE